MWILPFLFYLVVVKWGLRGVVDFDLLMGMSSFSGGSKVQMERVVSIVDAINGGKYPNCKTLAEKLEVSSKTIQRDITFIRDRLNYPLEYDEREYGYYFTEEVEDLARFDIQVEDLAALFLAKQTMGALKETKLADALRPSFDKLSQMMEGKVSLSSNELSDVFSVKSTGVVEADLTVFGKLAEAVLKQQVVQFKYNSVGGDGTIGNRVMHPYHVGEVNGGWYVVGRDAGKQALRTFALQRISELELMKERFEQVEEFDAANYFAGGVGVWAGDGDYDVRLLVSDWVARLVQERSWHPSQEVTVLGGNQAEVGMNLSSLEDMVSLVLSWGSKVKVLEPKLLLDMVLEEVNKMQHKP